MRHQWRRVRSELKMTDTWRKQEELMSSLPQSAAANQACV